MADADNDFPVSGSLGDLGPSLYAEKDLVWHGSSGARLSYRATAELVEVSSYDTGAALGRLFMMSYQVEDGTDDRPVTFLWNGGPGAASHTLNIGGLGPHYVPVRGPKPLSDPSVYRDNPYTLLQESDLVFVDALGCGLSQLAPGQDGRQVWGVDSDASLCASGVAAWLQKHGRYNCPLFLYGESYGTLRNALVFRLLGERGIAVTGVIGQSAILDYGSTLSGSDSYYLGLLPVYAATARYFGKAGSSATVEQQWDMAQEFAQDTLAGALAQADRMDDGALDKAARQMADLVGLDASYIKSCGLRIELDEFRRRLLAQEGKFCGRYDTRCTSYAYKPVQQDSEFFAGEDPALDGVSAPDVSAYLRLVQETGFPIDPNYHPVSYGVNQQWDWTHQGPGTQGMPLVPDGSFDLSCALRRNPRAQLLFVGGYYDAATPFWNVRHDMAKLFLPPELKAQVHWRLYETGHMTYADPAALAQLSADLKEFYEKCLRGLDD